MTQKTWAMHLITSFWAINALKAWQSPPRLETVKYEKFLKSDSFRLTELNTPVRHELTPVLLLVVRQQLIQFPFSTEKGGVAELIPPKGIKRHLRNHGPSGDEN